MHDVKEGGERAHLQRAINDIEWSLNPNSLIYTSIRQTKHRDRSTYDNATNALADRREKQVAEAGEQLKRAKLALEEALIILDQVFPDGF